MPAVIALLGPTNTGKTYHAIERLLAHRTGMIGFPLRLLARENYDRLVQLRRRGRGRPHHRRGADRSPGAARTSSARWRRCRSTAASSSWPSTRSSSPPTASAATSSPTASCGARGLEETMFLGAETIQPAAEAARAGGGVHRARAALHPDLRRAQEAGPAAAAERDRRLLPGRPLRSGRARAARDGRGGRRVRRPLARARATPRSRSTRRARWTTSWPPTPSAWASTSTSTTWPSPRLGKFDGRGPRPLRPAEVAQIAGRAGRHTRDGTFGADRSTSGPSTIGWWRRWKGITSRRSIASSGATRTSSSPRPPRSSSSLERRPPVARARAHARGGRPSGAGRPRRAIPRCAGRRTRRTRCGCSGTSPRCPTSAT